jgi:hypothetical protein
MQIMGRSGAIRRISRVRGSRPLYERSSSSRSEPMSLVNIELHRAVVAHLQQYRLAIVLISYVDALHDLEGLQGLFAKSD